MVEGVVQRPDVGRRGARDMYGIGPFDPQPLAAHRLQVLASGDEVHVGTTRGQAGTGQ